MHRKGFLSAVIMLGVYFYTQVSCSFSFYIFPESINTTTLRPPLHINYTFPFTPTSDIEPIYFYNKIYDRNTPIIADQQSVGLSFEQAENNPTITPSIEISTPIILTPTKIYVTHTSTASWTPLGKTNTPRPVSPTPSLTPLPFTGRLLISQVMYNPIGDEPENEWIELYNPENGLVDISFFKIGDEETKAQSEGMLMFPPNSSIQPRQTIVIANKSVAFFEVYGIKPTYEMSESDPDVPNLIKYTSWAKGNVSLNNESDEVILLDGADQIVDMVSWSKGDSDEIVPVVKEGLSIERMPADQDTNTRIDWVEQTYSSPFWVELYPPTPSPAPVQVVKSATPTKTPTPTSTLTPSPTSTDTQTPTSTSPPTAHPNGRLVISEVLFNPAPAASQIPACPYDVWMEVFNQDNFPVDLHMYRIGDEEEQNSPDLEGMYAFPEGSVIQARSTVVIAYMADRFMTKYNKEPDYEIINTLESVADMSLDRFYYYEPPQFPDIGLLDILNDHDEINLIYHDNQPVDAVAWGNSAFYSTLPQPPFHNPAVNIPPQGSSIERRNKDIDTDSAEDWQAQSNPSPGE